MRKKETKKKNTKRKTKKYQLACRVQIIYDRRNKDSKK